MRLNCYCLNDRLSLNHSFVPKDIDNEQKQNEKSKIFGSPRPIIRRSFFHNNHLKCLHQRNKFRQQTKKKQKETLRDFFCSSSTSDWFVLAMTKNRKKINLILQRERPTFKVNEMSFLSEQWKKKNIPPRVLREDRISTSCVILLTPLLLFNHSKQRNEEEEETFHS